MNITEFLEARIAEDEALARQEDEDYADTTLLPTYDSDHQANWNTYRVLAECAAKRAIIREHELSEQSDGIRTSLGCAQCNYNRDYGWEEVGPCQTLRAIAAVYADHPDYDQEAWG